MNFAIFIARRFMLGGKGAGPSRLNGWIAIIGLAIGCIAMILSVSVLNGFESRVINRIIGFEGDVRISDMTNWEKNIDKIRSMENVKEVLEAAGTSIGKVVKTTVYCTNSGHFSLVNDVYRDTVGRDLVAELLHKIGQRCVAESAG